MPPPCRLTSLSGSSSHGCGRVFIAVSLHASLVRAHACAAAIVSSRSCGRRLYMHVRALPLPCRLTSLSSSRGCDRVFAAVSSRSRGPLYARVCALSPPCRLRVPIRVVARLWSCFRRRVVAHVVDTRTFVRCRHCVVTPAVVVVVGTHGACVAAAVSSAVRACSCVNKGSACVLINECVIFSCEGEMGKTYQTRVAAAMGVVPPAWPRSCANRGPFLHPHSCVNRGGAEMGRSTE